MLLLAASQPGYAAVPGRVLQADPPRAIPDFELTDQDGKPFRLSQLRGRPLLVFFGFAHCPDVCPRTLQQLLLVTSSPDEAVRQARVVMISIDGERDKPADMKKYLAPLSRDFIGVTGDPRQVRDIAAQFSAVFFKGGPLDRAGNYNVEHTSQVYLLDRSGRLRATFFNTPVDAMIDATRAVATEKR